MAASFGKGRKFPDQSTEWTQWQWNESGRYWTRSRMDADGNWEYDYRYPQHGRDLDNNGVVVGQEVHENTTGYEGYAESIQSGENRIDRGGAAVAESLRAESLYGQEGLDSSDYCIHPVLDFTKGKILEILWSEPARVNESQISSSSASLRTVGEIYQVKRRYVIAQTFPTHCLCLPIMTYGGKGTAYPGVNGSDHAIIYTTNRPPKELTGEVELMKKSLQVTPNNSRHKLDRASRLNFAKIYTIEYNMKVGFIGNLTKPALKILDSEYKRVHSFSSEWKPRLPFRSGSTHEPNRVILSDDGPEEQPLPDFLTRPPPKDRSQATPQFRDKSILDISRVLRKVFTGAGQTANGVTRVKYQISWELPDILKSLPSSETLDNLSTITGDEVNAYATYCREYLFENWDELGPAVLRVVEQVSRSRKVNEWLPWEKVSPTVQITCCKSKSDFSSGSKLSVAWFEVMAEFGDQVKVGSALSWLCAAIRKSSEPGVFLSEASHEIDKEKTIRIKPCDLWQAPKRQMCWHELYFNPVIAHGYPIPLRQEGIGLEISFFHMTSSSGAISLTEYEGGLVAEGLTTVLIPEERLENDNAIQWHLERINQLDLTSWSSDNEDSSQTAESILARYSKRYKETNKEILSAQRAFLGWTDSATVSLGMKESLEREPTASGARIFGDGPRWKIASVSVGVGVSASGFSLSGPTLGLQPYAPNNKIAAQEKTRVIDLIRKSAQQYVMLYDAEFETAWQIPLANLILFMTHTLIIQDKRQVRKPYIKEGAKSFEPSSLPFSRGDADSGEEARDILLQSLELETLYNDQWTPLTDTLKEMFHDILLVKNGLAKAYQEAASGKPRMGTPKRILGIDLVQLILKDDSFDIRWCKVNQAWSYLAEALGLVLFCNNLGQAIIPGRTVCSGWRTVPTRKNYLVAYGESVLTVLKKNNTGTTDGKGSRLHDEILWKVKYPLVSRHGDGQACIHTQPLRIRLFNLAAIDENPNLIENVSSMRGGALIFTNDTAFFRRWLRSKRGQNKSDGSTLSFRSSVHDNQSITFSVKTWDTDSFRDNPSVTSLSQQEMRKKSYENRQSFQNSDVRVTASIATTVPPPANVQKSTSPEVKSLPNTGTSLAPPPSPAPPPLSVKETAKSSPKR